MARSGRKTVQEKRHRPAVSADALPPSKVLALAVYLRHRRQMRRPGSGVDLAELSTRVSRKELEAERRRILQRPLKQVRRFAERHGMKVGKVDFLSRCVTLRAKVVDAERAFATKLRRADSAAGGGHYPTRRPRLPAQLSKIVHSVLGLDTRPMLGRLRGHAGPTGGNGLYPSQIARLYGMATPGRGAGQCIAVIEPGGGYDIADIRTACRAMRVPVPRISDVNVGGRNALGANAQFDKEVALDLQVIAGVAPEARIVVYFTETSEPGLVAGIVKAVHDDKNRPNVIVVTWGEPETFWLSRAPEARKGLDAALQDAIRLGITVVATAGDDLATERMNDGHAHVNYPGSSPYVLGCGGTLMTLDAAGTAIADEVVWNEGMRGTGGGISDIYAVPSYQSSVTLPASRNDSKQRRGVPDVAAAAAEKNGYRIALRGAEIVASGTSAVAPLWGAFIALVNEQRGEPLGFVNGRLYQNPTLLRQITSGNNMAGGIGYAAGPGWNACTGLGVPIGPALIAALTAVA
jgi:kumamolisin